MDGGGGKKHINTGRTPLALLTSAFFLWKSENFVTSRNTDTDCILIHKFLFF